MNYWEDSKHRIQADMALRIGQIALQYSRLNLPPRENFTDTLHLCLLQNLLTNCKELLNAMNRNGGDHLGLHVPVCEMSDWGIDGIKITRYSFDAPLTVAEFLTHLRNAMSHPTGTDLAVDYSSSGYNSIPSVSGMIEAIAFCDSPDTRNNRPRDWPTQTAVSKHFRTLPSGVQIKRVDDAFRVFCEGHPYVREFLAILTTNQLRDLVRNLSNLLAQPAKDYWDGKTVTRIIAAA